MGGGIIVVPNYISNKEKEKALSIEKKDKEEKALKKKILIEEEKAKQIQMREEKEKERDKLRIQMKNDLENRRKINQKDCNNDIKIEWFGPMKPKDEENFDENKTV